MQPKYVKVFAHCWGPKGVENVSDNRFTRVPCVGEFLQFDRSPAVYRVTKVLHCDVQGEYEAEIMCEPDGKEATFSGRPKA